MDNTPFLFDAETRLDPVSDGRWDTHVGAQWNIGDNPNGGYLLSPVLRAMSLLSAHPDPLSVTTHFLRPGIPDAPAEVRASVVRTGRTVTTLRGELHQDGRQRLDLMAVFGVAPDAPGPGAPDVVVPRPVIGGPQECVIRSGLEQGVELPILNRVAIRLDPEQAQAGTAERAQVVGWGRFVDDREPDTLSLPMFADAFPPPVFSRLGYVGWVPTVELTVHIRRRPAPGWLLGQFMCPDLQDQRMIEDGNLWDSEGNLVARSRQIALLLRPADPSPQPEAPSGPGDPTCSR